MTEDTQKNPESSSLPAIRSTAELAAPIAPFTSMQGFMDAQRIAKALMSSKMIPEIYQNDMGSTLIAMELAQRTGSSILAIMQNLNIIHGKPSFGSSYCIATLNQSGRFAEPLHFEFVGTCGEDDWGCYGTTTTRSGRQVKGPTVTIKMAKNEGWYQRNGSKWPTMPELMLTYRAASFFTRTEAPEVLMGMQTSEEAHDIGYAEVEPLQPASLTSSVRKLGKASDVVKPDTASASPGIAENAVEGELIPASAGSDIAPPEWPKFLSGTGYIDSDGVVYNPECHADVGADGIPPVTASHSFHARRGRAVQARALAEKAVAKRQAKEAPPAQAEQDGEPEEGQAEKSADNGADDEAEKLTAFTAYLKEARTMPDLEAAEKAVDTLDPKHRGYAANALGVRYREMKAEGLI